jgi:competence protein ComEA
MNYRLKNKMFFSLFKVTFFMVIFLLAIFFVTPKTIFAGDLIDINTATLAELDSLPGIGPGRAQDIIDYREGPDGPFETTEEIKNVSGIGDSTWNNIKDLITVGTVSEPIEDPTETVACYLDLVINEILPDPEGSDDLEWIELKNTGDQTVDLAGYKIADATDKKFEISLVKFSDTNLGPGGFFILPKEKTNIALNNSGEERVYLFCPDGAQVQEVIYTDSVASASWARLSGDYQWTTDLTPGAKNNLVAPITAGENNDSETEDEESGTATKKTKPKYSKWRGKVFINEVMSNPIGLDPYHEWIEISNSSTESIIIKNWKIREDTGEYRFEKIKLKPFSYFLFQPDPDFFQLDNFAGEKIILTDSLGLEIDSLSYDKNVVAGESLNRCGEEFLWLTDTSLMQNNICPPKNENPKAYFDISLREIKTKDKVVLDARESFDTDGEIVGYHWSFDKKATETTWGFENKNFKTMKPLLEVFFEEAGKLKITLEVVDSLGDIDKFSDSIQVTGDSVSGPEKKAITETIQKTVASNSPQKETVSKNNIFSSGYSFISLENIRQLENNKKISTQGIVSVEPGILGVNIFYLSGSGIQVYMSSKDFPELQTGDKISLSGTLSEAYGEKRIKVKNKSDFQIISTNNSCEPHQVDISELGEDYEGNLVGVSGQVTEIGSDYFFLDDSSAEIKVYFKKTLGFDWKDLEISEGDLTEVVGIISETTSGYRLLPRYERDISLTKKTQTENRAVIGTGQVLGAKDISQKFGKKDYLISFLFFTIFILLIVILKIKKGQERISGKRKS